MNSILWIVIPCYNEQEMLPTTYKILKGKLDSLISDGKISGDSKLLFVNDGSTDDTWEILHGCHRTDNAVACLCLSKNRGHQNALLAGLLTSQEYADVTISIDADLQDDTDAIDRMIDAYADGANIVFGVRSSRKTDSFFKRFSAEAFYGFMKRMGAKTIFNHADFRLMDKTALNALAEYGESSVYLRGIAADIGLKTATVLYERKPREKGESKYPLKKMLSLAEDGVTSFSIKPLRFSFHLASFLLLLSITSTVFGVLSLSLWKIPFDVFFAVAAIFFTGSLILSVLGVMGIYIGKTYMETKKRPRYDISEFLK